ncbi:hypothetical protein ACET3Z_002015 [Daucus carota]
MARVVMGVGVFRAAQNVNVLGKADFSYDQGASAISAVLHGASVLLRLSERWDWFVNLSPAHYPLVTQDDLLHILSYLPKDLNFINHTSYIGWRESRKLKPIIVDPGLYLSEINAMFYATQKRDLPDAYQLFTGSAAGIVSRKLLEFCIFGIENFPRTLLMYLSNSPSAQSVYFPTLICNSKQFRKTIINHNLQHSALDDRQEPRPLNSSDLDDLFNTGAAFASPFLPDDPVLDIIDQKVLGRDPGKPTPGGWCLGESEDDICTEWGDAEVLRPGPGAKKLERSMVQLLADGLYKTHQCMVE